MVTQTNLNFVNCVLLAKLIDTNRYRVGFILRYFAELNVIKVHSQCKRTSYEILNKNKFVEMVEKLKNGDLDQELIDFKNKIMGRCS